MLLEIALVLIGTVCIMVPVWRKRWKFDISKLSTKLNVLTMMKMKRFKRDGYYEEIAMKEAYASLCDHTLPPRRPQEGGSLSKINAYKKEKSDLLSKIKSDRQGRLASYERNWLLNKYPKLPIPWEEEKSRLCPVCFEWSDEDKCPNCH